MRERTSKPSKRSLVTRFALLFGMITVAAACSTESTTTVDADTGSQVQPATQEEASSEVSEAVSVEVEAKDLSPADVELVLRATRAVTGNEDPWLQFQSSEFTKASLDLATVQSLGNALVLVESHSVERWYESPDGDENMDVPGRSAPNYLRIRADVTVLAGELPFRNRDGSIYLDLLMPHSEADRASFELPPAPYLSYVTATNLLKQEWGLLAEVVGKDEAEKHQQLREEGYIITTRGGLLVAYEDGLRAPLLETDLLHHVPDAFISTVERGFVLPESDAHGSEGEESLIPVVVAELEKLAPAAVVESSRGMPSKSSEDIVKAIDRYRAGARN